MLKRLERIKIYPIQIKSEADLVSEIVRIANLCTKMGFGEWAVHPIFTEPLLLLTPC